MRPKKTYSAVYGTYGFAQQRVTHIGIRYCMLPDIWDKANAEYLAEQALAVGLA